jgi:hypothetical protein
MSPPIAVGDLMIEDVSMQTGGYVRPDNDQAFDGLAVE